MNLSAADSGTEIQYTGDINVGGLIASVGQRMIQSTATMLAGRFFKSLDSEIKASETQTAEAPEIPSTGT